MALFSKPPPKKPGASKPDPRVRPGSAARPPSAHQVASDAGGKSRGPDHRPLEPSSPDITGASIIEWAPAQPAIEVAQANPGLCAVLENAALLFASGQAPTARTVLEQGLVEDHDARRSPLAWLALFDLLQRAGDKAAFDQLALTYVVQFERSAPAWEETHIPRSGPRAASTGGYVGMIGMLSAASAPQIDSLKRLSAKDARQPRLDLSAVSGFDDTGARLLADALAAVRRHRAPLLVERPEKLRRLLEAAVNQGRDGGEGAWLLLLELLQWQSDQAAFDDRAVEYAVTFELSPPSWEPPAQAAGTRPQPSNAPAPSAGDAEALEWNGAITGAATLAIAQLVEFAQSRGIVGLDISRVDRIDFVGAGSLLNAINRIEGQRKSVQIAGASPIVRALLLLIGVSPRHFLKKSA